MTAAHCLKFGAPLMVRLGTVFDTKKKSWRAIWIQCETFYFQTDLKYSNDPLYGEVQDVKISQIIQHPEYKSGQQFNDIALAKLERDVDISTMYVYPACLNIRDNIPIASDIVQVIGWGETEDDIRGDPTEVTSRILLMTNVTGMSQGIR